MFEERNGSAQNYLIDERSFSSFFPISTAAKIPPNTVGFSGTGAQQTFTLRFRSINTTIHQQLGTRVRKFKAKFPAHVMIAQFEANELKRLSMFFEYNQELFLPPLPNFTDGRMCLGSINYYKHMMYAKDTNLQTVVTATPFTIEASTSVGDEGISFTQYMKKYKGSFPKSSLTSYNKSLEDIINA